MFLPQQKVSFGRTFSAVAKRRIAKNQTALAHVPERKKTCLLIQKVRRISWLIDLRTRVLLLVTSRSLGSLTILLASRVFLMARQRSHKLPKKIPLGLSR